MPPRPKYTTLNPSMYEYLLAHRTPDDDVVLRRLRPGGLVAVDNVLWDGDVVRRTKRGEDVEAIRRFNDTARADARVESVMLPVADGLTLARKLP